MQSFIPWQQVSANGRPSNNPVNLTGDVFPRAGERSSLYGDLHPGYVTTGVQLARQPQQEVIFRDNSRNTPGHPGLIPTHKQINQIGAATGSTLSMGSQTAGMNTSLSGARERSGRSGRP